MIDFDDKQAVIKDFRQWLGTKNPDEEYDYVSNGNCAFAQYLKARGQENPSVAAWSWGRTDGNGIYHSLHDLPFEIDDAVLRADPRNFGNVARYLDMHA